jgi:hypothetical protein
MQKLPALSMQLLLFGQPPLNFRALSIGSHVFFIPLHILLCEV